MKSRELKRHKLPECSDVVDCRRLTSSTDFIVEMTDFYVEVVRPQVRCEIFWKTRGGDDERDILIECVRGQYGIVSLQDLVGFDETVFGFVSVLRWKPNYSYLRSEQYEIRSHHVVFVVAVTVPHNICPDIEAIRFRMIGLQLQVGNGRSGPRPSVPRVCHLSSDVRIRDVVAS